MKKQFDKYTVRALISILCIVIIPKMLLVFLSNPLRTPSDEIGTLGVASYLAGLDWSGVIPRAGYYGFGFTGLFFWVFLLTDNPFIIYKIFLFISVLLQSIGSFVTYYVCRKYKIINNNVVCILLSCVSGYMVVTRSNVIYNEQMLICISWLLLPLLFGLFYNQENQRRKKIYTLLTVLLLTYSLTVHVRAIVLFLSLICIIIIYALFEKKCLVELRIFIPVFVLGYLACQFFSKELQELLWSTAEGLRNTSISIDSPSDFWLYPPTWHAWANIVIGQIYTVVIITGGIVIPILLFAYVRGKSFIIGHEKKIDNIFFIFLFFVICIAATIFGQSLSWLEEAVNAITAGFENNAYGTKAFTYLRYFGPYLGPLIMLGLCNILKNINLIRKKIESIVLLFGVLTFFWIVAIYPFFFNTVQTGTLEALYPFSLGSVLDATRIRTTLPSCILTILIFSVFLALMWKKKIKSLLVGVTILLAYQYIYNAIRFDINYQDEQLSKVENTYTILEDIKDTILPEIIYVFDSKDVGHGTYFTYQFYFNRFHIEAGIPEKVSEEIVLLSDIELPEQSESFYEYQVSDNQYIYTNIEEIIDYLEEV